jgi:hypothetical protein
MILPPLKHFLDSLIIREFGAAHCEVHLADPPRQGAVTDFKDCVGRRGATMAKPVSDVIGSAIPT